MDYIICIQSKVKGGDPIKSKWDTGKGVKRVVVQEVLDDMWLHKIRR